MSLMVLFSSANILRVSRYMHADDLSNLGLFGGNRFFSKCIVIHRISYNVFS